MGKKVKEKSSKEKVETKGNKVKSKKNESRFGIWSMLIAGIVLLKVLVSMGTLYHIYNTLIKVPDMPQVDLDVFWGSNVTDERDTSIRPFRIVFTEAMEAEIRVLFEDYRRMNRKIKSFEDTAWTYGVHSDAFAQFFANWLFKYKFRERVRFLNKFEHFKTNIQGLDIHFMRVKPKVKDNIKVLPLLLLHGWPGSVREFYEAIPLLTTPRPGCDFVFEVIAPSLPGFIYSEGATRPGLNTFEIAIIIRNLMQRLGFKQYYIQGGDYGHSVASHLATVFPKEVLGFHTNFPANFTTLSYLTWLLGAIWPAFVGSGIADRMYPLTEKLQFYIEESGYMHLQATKPDTIGVMLQDSPVGLAAYILDRFMIFTDPENKFQSEGGLDKYYDLNKLTDNIMLYWVTGSITTSMRLYKESFRSSELEQHLSRIPTPVPTWALRFKHELIQHPDFVLRWKYPNLLGSTNVEHGGHFAAFERPEEFAEDVFKAVKSFLNFHK